MCEQKTTKYQKYLLKNAYKQLTNESVLPDSAIDIDLLIQEDVEENIFSVDEKKPVSCGDESLPLFQCEYKEEFSNSEFSKSDSSDEYEKEQFDSERALNEVSEVSETNLENTGSQLNNRLSESYGALSKDVKADYNINSTKRLSKRQLDIYSINNQEVGNIQFIGLTSKKPMIFKAEDYFDGNGNEIDVKDESQNNQESVSEDKIQGITEVILKDLKPEKDIESNCFLCKYFYVTWNIKSPRGCRYFDFITDRIPAEYVHEVFGKDCNHYIDKFSNGFEKILSDAMNKENEDNKE